MLPRKPCSPRYTRRAPWHDYRSRSIYMITISKSDVAPPFSFLSGTPSNINLTNSQIGDIIKDELNDLHNRHEELIVYQSVIMPDHIHFILQVIKPTSYHLGKVIGEFKGRCTRRTWELAECCDFSIFEDRFHDRILLQPGQLETMKRYIIDNPRRLLIKQTFPDLFQRKLNLKLNGINYESFGNIFLLRNPFIEQVKVSRHFSADQLMTLDQKWRTTIEEGGVLVSPFISPRERIYRDLAIENGGNLITLEENGFGERFKPMGRFFDLCAQGRLFDYRSWFSPSYSRKNHSTTGSLSQRARELHSQGGILC